MLKNLLKIEIKKILKESRGEGLSTKVTRYFTNTIKSYKSEKEKLKKITYPSDYIDEDKLRQEMQKILGGETIIVLKIEYEQGILGVTGSFNRLTDEIELILNVPKSKIEAKNMSKIVSDLKLNLVHEINHYYQKNRDKMNFKYIDSKKENHLRRLSAILHRKFKEVDFDSKSEKEEIIESLIYFLTKHEVDAYVRATYKQAKFFKQKFEKSAEENIETIKEYIGSQFKSRNKKKEELIKMHSDIIFNLWMTRAKKILPRALTSNGEFIKDDKRKTYTIYGLYP